MHDFSYRRPGTLAAAVAAFADSGDARYLAGGQSLIPMLKHRLAEATDIIDLGALPGLSGVRVDGGEVAIGALTTHAEVAADAELRRLIPGLAALAGGIGDPAVRNRGTLGGSVAHADPAADYPAALLALGARIRTDRRSIDADAFFTGMLETALEDGEIVTEVAFPVPDRAIYLKFPSPASRYAVVGVMVARRGAEVRVAVTGAAASVFRAVELEEALRLAFRPDVIDGIPLDPSVMNADLHASPEYRAHLVGVLAKRAVAALS